MKILTSTAIAIALAAPAFAQVAVTIDVAESEVFGRYLTDAEGRPVYVFSTDTQATDEQEAEVSCTDAACLEAWPLVTTSDDPEAGEGVNASLLGTTTHDDQQVVTYDGWPLYYFVRDESAEDPRGHEIESFGGVWSVVAPVAQLEAGDIAAGETLYADACAQCHGRTGRGMASFPSVAGHDADYIATRLMQYRAGETVGPNSALMRPVAAVLSDQDIANLSAFISTNFD